MRYRLEDLVRCGCESEPLGTLLHDLELDERPRDRRLNPGEHRMTINYREDGALLDAIGITTYPFGMKERESATADVKVQDEE